MIMVSVSLAYLVGGIAKGHHAVAHGFDARHRRAAAGKRSQHEPRADGSGDPANCGGAITGTGWPPAASVLKTPTAIRPSKHAIKT